MKDNSNINTIYKIIILHLFTFWPNLTLPAKHGQTHSRLRENRHTLDQVADSSQMQELPDYGKTSNW